MTGPEHPRPDLSGWQVHISAVPVAILAADGMWPQRDRELLHDLAGGLAYGFDAIREKWEVAHVGLPVAGYRLGIQAASDDAAPPLSLADVQVDDWTAEVSVLVSANAFAELADADIRASQALMADVVIQAAQRVGVAADLAASLRRSWVEAMPTLAVRIVEARTSRPELSSPLEIDEAFTGSSYLTVGR